MNTTTNTVSRDNDAPRCFGGKVVLYHPKRSGKGAAARFELRLNRPSEESYDCFFLEMASQKPGSPSSRNASFDWENKITVKLDFMDVSEILTVLEGKAASVGGERKALYHQINGSSTLIGLAAREDGNGYFLGLSKKSSDGKFQNRISLSLSQVEATGLKQVLGMGLFYISFHSSLSAATWRS